MKLNTVYSFVAWLWASLLISGWAHAESALEIMLQVDLQQRQIADATLSKSTLSTCRFTQQGSRIACAETPRVKVMESVSVQGGPDKKDSQNISIILDPASERGIGMLTYSYDDSTKDTESWLYLSALGKVKRMASGTGDDQEPVSLFGSEFTTEDMETGKTDEYDYRILQQGPYSGRNVWVIEALPKPIRRAKTNYSRLLFWIDKERLVALKVQAYDKYNAVHKRILFKDLEQINTFWFARHITVFNLKSGRLSTMETAEIAMNVDVAPEFLTPRTLTDLAFREQNLRALRKYFR